MGLGRGGDECAPPRPTHPETSARGDPSPQQHESLDRSRAAGRHRSQQRIARGPFPPPGDSIFDNAAYVRSEPSVLEHVRQAEMTRTTRVGSKPRRSRPRPKPRAQVVKSSLSSQKSTLTSPNRNSQTKRSRRSRNSNRFPPKRGLQRLLIHKRHHLTENLRGAQSTHSGGKIRSGREGPVAAGIRTAKSVYAEQAAARVINVSVDELFAIADRFRCPRTHEQAEEWQGPERPELA